VANQVVLTLITAIGFGLWPSVARLSGLSPIMVGLIVASVTVIPVIFAAPFFEIGPVTKSGFLMAFTAGLINGVGFTAYSKLVSSNLELSKSIPAMIVLSLLVAFLSGLFIFSEKLTAEKIIGIVLAVFSSWFLLK